MRKFILITAMVLASATAQAGQSRNLTVAENEPTATVAQPASEATKSAEVKPAETPAPAEAAKPADAPKYVERPAAVDAATDQAKPKSTDVTKADKPKRRHESTEARVIYELHRHGIYW